VVVYANTSAAVKARADWVVTSSIAVDVVKHLTARGEKIIWAPDRHLGRYHLGHLRGIYRNALDQYTASPAYSRRDFRSETLPADWAPESLAFSHVCRRHDVGSVEQQFR